MRTVGNARAHRRVRARRGIAHRAIAGGLAGAMALNPFWCAAASAGVGSGALSTTGLAPSALAPSPGMLPVPLVPAPEGETMLLAVRVNGVDRDDTVRGVVLLVMRFRTLAGPSIHAGLRGGAPLQAA